MTSKKQPSTKRSALPRTSDYTKTFLKDWERLTRSGRFDMNRLKEAMLLLIANDGPIGAEWLDHPLKGNKAAFRECHVGGDFLLMYRIEATSQGEAVVFVRAGTHADLLCRYLLRPPLAKARLHETMDGRYALELKNPWPDGTRVIFFSGEELVARLTALVPPPRMHLVHYFGCLAPNARLRRLIVPVPPDVEDGSDDPLGHSVAWEQTSTGRTIRRTWVPWATLLMRVFAIDVLECPKCASRMQRIAVIMRPDVIQAILACARGKAPPEGEAG